MNFTSDLHVHTHLSSCAKPEATVAYYLDKAREIGLKTIGFTDHLWDSAVPGASKWYAKQDFAHISRLREELDAADKTGVDRVLFGAECEYDYKGHGVAISPAVAEQLDVLLVPNSHTHMTVVMPREYYQPRRHAEFMLEAFYDILNSEVSRYITAIPHPFAAVNCAKYPPYYPPTYPLHSISDDEFRRCFALAARKGIALEINPYNYREAPVEDIESHELSRERIRMYRIAKSEGCLFTVGVDAHGYGYHDHYHLIEPVAELIGITENDLHPLAR